MTDVPVLVFVLAVLVSSTPVLLAAVGEALGERAGILNVGVEGLLLCGAFAAFAASALGVPPAVAVAAGALAGALLALPFAAVVVLLGADAVVAGTALNLLAVGLTGAVLPWVDAHARAPVTGPHPLFLPATGVGIAALAWWFLQRTRPGLLLRACGDDARGAAAAGVPVRVAQVLTVTVSGACAGLGGAQLALVEARGFVEEMSAGRGFVALALVVLARRSLPGVVAAAFGFGALLVLQFKFQARGVALPYQAFLVLPYAATLVLLAVLLGRRRHRAVAGAVDVRP